MCRKLHMPQVPKSALKHYWSVALDSLKNDSRAAFELWKAAGKPQTGTIFDMKKNAKYKYKLAIRDAIKQSENIFSDELYDHICKKDFNKFWVTWNNKTGQTLTNVMEVSGSTVSAEISEKIC